MYHSHAPDNPCVHLERFDRRLYAVLQDKILDMEWLQAASALSNPNPKPIEARISSGGSQPSKAVVEPSGNRSLASHDTPTAKPQTPNLYKPYNQALSLIHGACQGFRLHARGAGKATRHEP